MPGPKLPEYPKPLYKPDVDPIQAMNAKDEERLIAEGWSEHYIHREFPKWLYHKKDPKIVVSSKAEQTDAEKRGYREAVLTARNSGGPAVCRPGAVRAGRAAKPPGHLRTPPP